MQDHLEYEPLDVPRPVWWLLTALLATVFGLIFLGVTITYLSSPALDCELTNNDTVVECDEVPVATTVFAVAAAAMGVVAVVSAVVFLALGGVSTLPWVREQVRGVYRAVRGR